MKFKLKTAYDILKIVIEKVTKFKNKSHQSNHLYN